MWVSLSLRLWWIVAIAPNPPYRLIRRTALNKLEPYLMRFALLLAQCIGRFLWNLWSRLMRELTIYLSDAYHAALAIIN